MKLTMYGASICEDCVEIQELLKSRDDIQVDYRSITETTGNLKEFLAYRDNEEIFKDIKANGKIGIPFFILEDGAKTFDLYNYLGMERENMNPSINACSIDGTGNC